MTNFKINKKTNLFHLVVALLESSHQYPSNKRDKEVFSTNTILSSEYPNEKLIYDFNKAPKLSSNKAVSISHCEQYIGLIISQNKAAIDIEKISDKALRVSSKFLSPKEMKWANSNQRATLLWCAKECLYKIHQMGKLTFASDLKIQSVNKNTIEASIFDHNYSLFYEKFDQHWLVYYYD